MTDLGERLESLDRIVHEPARLVILTALDACKDADFLYLQRVTGLTKGNLSAHLARLENAGLLTLTKSFVGRTPRTAVAITGQGRTRLAAHWRTLTELRENARAAAGR